ncbi:MAG TPA: hypothetical protein VJ652_00045, partial [Noviherbaspirillum sp.]|nr:hypothetical protein [Noviherbaspirillum sp.]
MKPAAGTIASAPSQLLERDLAVQKLPRILIFLAADLRDQFARIEAAEQRLWADARAAPVQPQRGFRRHQRQAVAGLARAPVLHARRVIPHAVEISDIAACAADCVMQHAVGEFVRAVQDGFGRRVPLRMPVLAHPFHAAVDAACRHQHHVGAHREILVR